MKLLTVYSVIKFGERSIKGLEKNVLIYYIRKGINDETLEMVSNDLTNEENYYGINKQESYLIASKTNLRKFGLNEGSKTVETLLSKSIKTIHNNKEKGVKDRLEPKETSWGCFRG
jgi:hypothetical protein